MAAGFRGPVPVRFVCRLVSFWFDPFPAWLRCGPALHCRVSVMFDWALLRSRSPSFVPFRSASGGFPSLSMHGVGGFPSHRHHKSFTSPHARHPQPPHLLPLSALNLFHNCPYRHLTRTSPRHSTPAHPRSPQPPLKAPSLRNPVPDPQHPQPPQKVTIQRIPTPATSTTTKPHQTASTEPQQAHHALNPTFHTSRRELSGAALAARLTGDLQKWRISATYFGR